MLWNFINNFDTDPCRWYQPTHSTCGRYQVTQGPLMARWHDTLLGDGYVNSICTNFPEVRMVYMNTLESVRRTIQLYDATKFVQNVVLFARQNVLFTILSPKLSKFLHSVMQFTSKLLFKMWRYLSKLNISTCSIALVDCNWLWHS